VFKRRKRKQKLDSMIIVKTPVHKCITTVRISAMIEIFVQHVGTGCMNNRTVTFVTPLSSITMV